MDGSKLTYDEPRQTKLIVLGSKKLKLLVKFRGNDSKTENNVRYLGVQIDRNLSFTEHI